MTEPRITAEWVAESLGDAAFRQRVETLLMDLCAIDTTPGPDVSRMRDAERACFQLITSFLKSDNGAGRFEHKPIDPSIATHSAYSTLYFTQDSGHPGGQAPEEVYRDRGNLLFLLDGEPDPGGRNVAVNAHIDVVHPYFPPRREGDRLFGRGIIDDKGNVAVLCAALRLIQNLADEGRITLKNKITGMFVVEEETGGNGSLSLALDRRLKERYDALLVLECAGNGIYPANRGAVWFKVDLTKSAQDNSSGYLPEAMAFGILAMQEEGRRIKAESGHALFPHRPVQTCNGILGPFGEHPSRICGRVVSTLTGPGLDHLEHALNTGLEAYIAHHGDKTQVLDPVTGTPKVAQHYTLKPSGSGCLLLTVYGSTGHMGSILDNDDAILKWAFLVRALVNARQGQAADWTLALDGADTTQQLVLEGGQGFLPTHTIEDIQQRMQHSFQQGLALYADTTGAPQTRFCAQVSFDKLHNAAFDGDPDSPTLRNALTAGCLAGITTPGAPVRGWDVSCDARLFATEYPELPVLTSGAGELKFAHSDHEQLYLPDLWNAIHFCTLFLLTETGVMDEN